VEAEAAPAERSIPIIHSRQPEKVIDAALTTTSFQRTAVSIQQEHVLPQLPRSNTISSEESRYPSVQLH